MTNMSRTLRLATLLVPMCLAAQVFEVATVKFAGSDARLWRNPQRSGPQIQMTLTRLMMVSYAHSIRSERVSGLAPDSEFFTVQAVTDPAATEEQVRLMLRALLEERFHLRVHRGTKELPSYVLSVSGKGPKLQAAGEGTGRNLPGRLSTAKFGPGVASLLEGNQHVVVGRKVTLAAIAAALEGELGGAVRDDTGLSGEFDFNLIYSPEMPVAGEPLGPSIYAALQEQLGLKLDRNVGPVETLVVDHIDKMPTDVN